MLVFIADNLMTKEMQTYLKVKDLLPISFAIAEGKMYSMLKNTIITQGLKPWGSNNIFGMVYNLPDNEYYLRKLDAFYDCSLSGLLRNHVRDTNHRKRINVIPINPTSLENLASHKYKLGNSIECWAWLANKDHPAIKRRIKYDHNRIRPGANVEAMKEAFQSLK